jgi:hypothetical protein
MEVVLHVIGNMGSHYIKLIGDLGSDYIHLVGDLGSNYIHLIGDLGLDNEVDPLKLYVFNYTKIF